MTPAKAAYRLTHILNVVSDAHGTPRFPIDVQSLALEAGAFFGWTDKIVEVKSAAIGNFEGALLADDARARWMLLYNDRLASAGRIRFTQAHELGHYILHRQARDTFECSEDDMLQWSDDETNIEAQADAFAATLLMPLDDFRQQVNTSADFETLASAATRYGMSLTAATLRWLEHTEAIAALVVHRDGFMLWACSSKPAMQAGAFFKTRKHTIAVPEASLAMNSQIHTDRTGCEIPATVWFPHADAELSLREMKICADNYDWTMSLLVLPRSSRVWPPRVE